VEPARAQETVNRTGAWGARTRCSPHSSGALTLTRGTVATTRSVVVQTLIVAASVGSCGAYKGERPADLSRDASLGGFTTRLVSLFPVNGWLAELRETPSLRGCGVCTAGHRAML
jgi:hypothetical protein